MPKHTALTIGPIYQSLQKARNTRGVWGSSYLFSHLMQSIIEKLDYKQKEFVMPLVSDGHIFQPHQGAGLFPDRLIFRSPDGQLPDGGSKELAKAIDDVLKEFVAKPDNAEKPNNLKAVTWGIEKDNKDNKANTETSKATRAGFREFLREYLLLYAVEMDVPEGKNVIEHCSDALARLELQQPLPSPYEIDYLHYFLLGVHKSAMYENAFGKGRRFPSLIEISSGELAKIPKKKYPDILKKTEGSEPDEDKEEADFVKELKEEYGDDFLRRHKYIAIVTADGDNLGKTVQQIYGQDEKAVKEVDEILLDFNLAAVNIIGAHGGRAVYVGGDDLLFFAPVGYGETSVFHLVEVLSAAYDNFFKTFFEEKRKMRAKYWTSGEGEVKPPTLSFGLSVSYYKYPLFEALADARNLLEENAKKEQSKRKNALAFRVRKHSGQTFGAVLFKDTLTYSKDFTALTSAPADKEASFLSSVHQHLQQHEASLLAALGEAAAGDRDPLGGYFDNHFNEPVHERNRPFLDTVKDMLTAAAMEFPNDRKSAIAQVFATLRFLHFYNQPDSDD